MIVLAVVTDAASFNVEMRRKEWSGCYEVSTSAALSAGGQSVLESCVGGR